MSEAAQLRRELERERAARRAAEDELAARSEALHADNTALKKRAAACIAAIERREAALFHESPIALFEVDLSSVRALIDRMREDGAIDPRRWIEAHPEEVLAAHAAIVVKAVNRAGLVLLDADDVDTLRTHAEWFFKGEYLTAINGFIEAAFEGRTEYSAETRVYAIGRRAVDVALTARANVGSERSLDSMICSLVNITAQKKAERALLASKTQIERSLRRTAHFLNVAGREIRSPLNAVMGLAQLLESDDALGSTQHEKAQLISQGGEQLMAIVDDLIELSRLESRGYALAPEPVRLRDLAADVERTWRTATEVRGLALSVRVAGSGVESARIDLQAVRTVINKLVENAVQFTTDGSVDVTIGGRTMEGDERLVVRVVDTGCGFNPELAPQIWDRFDRDDLNAWRSYGGAGIGLAIVKRLVDAMGGVAVADGAPGRGARFSVDVPTTFASAGVEPIDLGSLLDDLPDAGTVNPAPAALNVLVVEDNVLNQRVLAAMLDALSVDVTIVGDGLEAIDAVQAHEFDLVLMDICMPRLDGAEATRRIRALGGRHAETPIIAVTANAMPGDRHLLLEAGIDDIVPKPIDGAALATALATWGERARERRVAAG